MLSNEQQMYRQYTNCDISQNVDDTYKLNHKNQTCKFVCSMWGQHLKFDKGKFCIFDLMEKLDKIVDDSDPDTKCPQSVHAYQTAEQLRKDFPSNDWLHLVGLLHDLGKVLMLPEFGELPPWSVVGDTFPVGCKHSKKIIKHEHFAENMDTNDRLYGTKLGVYEEFCGVSNLMMSWGHDEYLYQVLKNAVNKQQCVLPKIGLKIIRLHSFYAWHEQGAYKYFMKSKDIKLLEEVQKFNKADLYTKHGHFVAVTDEMKKYYKNLINKYFLTTVLDW